MKWMTSLILLAAIGGANLQCFTTNDDFQAATYSTDLSGITDFGLDLYKQLSPGHSPKNFFFSPYSIWSAFTLAYFGSAGNTQRELEAALRVSDKVSTLRLWRDLDALYKHRQRSDPKYTFSLANRAYVKESLKLRPCIEVLLQNELRTLNSSNIAGSVNEINNFVKETTRGRISQIVNAGAISRAVMVLVNAAYFKGTWKYQFDPQETRQRDFFISSRDKIPIAMMSLTKEFRYGESKELGARVLELPYSGDTISMFILLPNSGRPFGAQFVNMVNNLNGATLRNAISSSNLALRTVDVQLPRFKFDMEIKTELIKGLINMGIVDIFDRVRANLSTFSPGGGLYVSQVIHKAFIEVNEEGTEAAAATAILIDVRIQFKKPQPIPFHCNEPFIFLIHDNETKNVLFMGAIKNPRG